MRHGFFGRQGGVSEGVWASLNVGLRSGDRPDGSPPTGRGRGSDWAWRPTGSSRPARSMAPTARGRGTPVGQRGRARSRRAGHRPSGPAAGRAHRRLRPGAAGRSARRASSAPRMPAGRVRWAACWRAWSRPWSGWVRAPERIAAALGPCIAQTSYEVGPEFLARFTARRSRQCAALHAQGGRALIRSRRPISASACARAGVGRVDVMRARHLRGRGPVLQLPAHHAAAGGAVSACSSPRIVLEG